MSTQLMAPPNTTQEVYKQSVDQNSLSNHTKNALKKMHYEDWIDTLLIPKYVTKLIESKELKYYDSENPIAPVLYTSIVPNPLGNKGRTDGVVGSKKSDKVITQMMNEYENPEKGYYRYTPAVVFLPTSSVGNGVDIYWENHGFYHRTTAGKKGNFESIPGIRLVWGDDVPQWRRDEIIQSLHDEENNPNNHPASLETTKSDTQSSLKKQSKIFDNIPIGSLPLNKDGSVMNKTDFLSEKLRKMGMKSETSRLNLIEKFLGDDYDYANVFTRLSGSETASEFIKRYYTERKFDDIRGKLKFPKDWEGFKAATLTKAIPIFTKMPIKYKVITIKLDSYEREMFKIQLDTIKNLVENNESYNVGLILQIDMLFKSVKPLKEKRRTLATNVQLVVDCINSHLKNTSSKGNVEILGLLGQVGKKEEKDGIIFYNDYINDDNF
jgi:hypothetical protein